MYDCCNVSFALVKQMYESLFLTTYNSTVQIVTGKGSLQMLAHYYRCVCVYTKFCVQEDVTIG